MGFFQARILEWVAIFLLQGIVPIQGLNPGLLGLSELQAERPRRPGFNPWMGTIQGLNPGLLGLSELQAESSPVEALLLLLSRFSRARLCATP